VENNKKQHKLNLHTATALPPNLCNTKLVQSANAISIKQLNSCYVLLTLIRWRDLQNTVFVSLVDKANTTAQKSQYRNTHYVTCTQAAAQPDYRHQ